MTETPLPREPEIKDTPTDRAALEWMRPHIPGAKPVPEDAGELDAYWLKYLAMRAYHMDIDDLFNLIRMAATEVDFTKDPAEVAKFRRAGELLTNVVEFRMGP